MRAGFIPRSFSCLSFSPAFCLVSCLAVLQAVLILPAQAQWPQNAVAMEKMGQPAAEPGPAAISEWFKRYDLVRYRAQMNPQERAQADGLLSRGLSVFIPGPEKAQAQNLLGSLVQRYEAAAQALEALPVLAQTEQLQGSYHEYFVTAGRLFRDYLTVQNNPMAQDASGQPLLTGLMAKKQALENFEHSVKNLDAQMRQRYGIAAYAY